MQGFLIYTNTAKHGQSHACTYFRTFVLYIKGRDI